MPRTKPRTGRGPPPCIFVAGRIVAVLSAALGLVAGRAHAPAIVPRLAGPAFAAWFHDLRVLVAWQRDREAATADAARALARLPMLRERRHARLDDVQGSSDAMRATDPQPRARAEPAEPTAAAEPLARCLFARHGWSRRCGWRR